VIESLKYCDFVTVHIEAPDECTHNGDIEGKVQAIEWVDSRIVAPLIKHLNETGDDFRMLIMADHRTLISTRGHDAGPVPFILYDSRKNEKTGLSYNEADAALGIHISDGTKLMEMLFDG
jgi:2,3-bisphosphoglycerate-independent phosphoglycerate mutase